MEDNRLVEADNPNALVNKKDLGVHTEMLTTGLMKLAKLGVINGKKKQTHKGKMVCTFALGNQELYEFVRLIPVSLSIGRKKIAVAESSLLQNFHAKSKNQGDIGDAQNVVEMFTPHRPS